MKVKTSSAYQYLLLFSAKSFLYGEKQQLYHCEMPEQLASLAGFHWKQHSDFKHLLDSPCGWHCLAIVTHLDLTTWSCARHCCIQYLLAYILQCVPALAAVAPT